MNCNMQALSTSGILLMKQMAMDASKSQILVQDEVCMGGLIMVLSNSDLSVVTAALEILKVVEMMMKKFGHFISEGCLCGHISKTLVNLSQWPHLRAALGNLVGMKEQLGENMSKTVPGIQKLATQVYNVLYGLSDLQTSFYSQSEVTSSNDSVSHMVTSHNSKAQRARRNSFFVGGATKAKTIVLQIQGMDTKDDMELCRSHLVIVPGVISITFNLSKSRALVRTKHDIQPKMLAEAVAETLTMSAEHIIKNEDGSETVVPLHAKLAGSLPEYPEDVVASPVSNNQRVAKHGTIDSSKSWGFIQSIGSFISNSFYW